MDKAYYKEYYHLERNHWWFKARLEILEKIIQKQILSSNTKTIRILNAGVATGATSLMLQKYGELTSLEYDKECCDFLEEVVKIEVINGSLTELPFEDDYFDLVCAFDVIEHIEDDNLAVQEIQRVLKTNGHVFLTVPAYQFLWSEHDVINHHFRRYTQKQLTKVVANNKFKVEFKSYFNFLLFTPIFIVRMLAKLLPQKTKASEASSDFEKFKGNGIVNRLFFWLFKKEGIFLTRKWRFPFGVSIMIIGKK